MLLDEKERGDGLLHVERRFKKTEAKLGYNSGVYVRTALDGKNWYQVQVADPQDLLRLGDIFWDEPTGGGVKRVVIRGEGSSRARPPGEWNTYEITCKGKRTQCSDQRRRHHHLEPRLDAAGTSGLQAEWLRGISIPEPEVEGIRKGRRDGAPGEEAAPDCSGFRGTEGG